MCLSSARQRAAGPRTSTAGISLAVADTYTLAYFSGRYQVFTEKWLNS